MALSSCPQPTPDDDADPHPRNLAGEQASHDGATIRIISATIATSHMESRKPDLRLAEPQDVAALPEIGKVAGLLFKGHPTDLGIPDELYDRPNSVETFTAAQTAGRLWVACGPAREPIGFALVLDIAGFAHLEELDVLPSYGRQGVGSALLATVCTFGVDFRSSKAPPCRRSTSSSKPRSGSAGCEQISASR